MHLDEYQAAAQGTAGTPLECSLLGLAGEAGEVCDYFKKVLHHGHVQDNEHIIKELGDVLWYVADIASQLGLSLNQIAVANIAKLQRRYPHGFSQQASRDRNV